MRAIQVEYNLYKKESIELKANLQKQQLDKSTTEIRNGYETQIRDMKLLMESNAAKHLKDIANMKANMDSIEIQRSNSLK
jgi:hypothetical protein